MQKTADRRWEERRNKCGVITNPGAVMWCILPPPRRQPDMLLKGPNKPLGPVEIVASAYQPPSTQWATLEATSMHWQLPHHNWRCLAGPVHNTPGAHAGPVAMVASNSRASHPQVVVAKREKRLQIW